MTAKEYLKQAYLLDKQIQVEVKELEQLREMRGRIQGCSYGEKIGTNPNRNLEAPFIKTIEKIWDYEQRIDAQILRLVESGVITEEKARNLYQEKSESIAIRIELTGKAEQWQQNSGSLLRYGSLLDNLAFNSEHELLVDSREESDRAYLEKIGKEFRNRK